MDSIFHPDFKRWIHRQYPFSTTATDVSQSQNAEPSDKEVSTIFDAVEQGQIEDVVSQMCVAGGSLNPLRSSRNKASHKSELLALSGILKFEPREAMNVPDEMISDLGVDIAENLCEERADDLLDAFEDDDDDDQLSLASDVSDTIQSHTRDVVEEITNIGTVADTQNVSSDAVSNIGTSSVPVPAEIEIGAPAIRFVIERKRPQIEQPVVAGVVETRVKRSERLKKKIRTEDQVPVKKERQDKVSEQVENEKSNAQELPGTSAASFTDATIEVSGWEDSVRTGMKMTKKEYSEFVQLQGFKDKSNELADWMDFGTPDPKGCPKSALPIHQDVCEKSNTLRIYQNICKPNSVSGSMATNALDLSFYQPRRVADCESSTSILGAEDLIVTVDLYFPSVSNVQFRDHAVQKMKLPAVCTTISIVAKQTVKDLYDKLHCENDLVPIKEIMTLKELDQLEKVDYAAEKDESSSIFIHDTLYVVKQRNSFADAMKEWKGQKLLENPQPIQVRLMSEYQIKDTYFRPGYPYLYRHHGCEHLLVFTNVRKVHPTDPKSLELYPRVTYIQTLPPLKCRVDSNHIAKVIVKDDPRLPESSTPLCKECCSEFCFTKRGKREIKTSDMKLYPLIQMGNLPMSNIII